MADKPNIVLFVPDSYRGDVLGHQGDTGAVTPNLDALVARDAVSYGNAFAQNPVCTPSRCSFMTGWYPHVHGHRSMRNMLKEQEPNLLTVLRREGYHVWWGGKNDLVRVRERADFLRYCDEKFWPGGKYSDHMEYRQPPSLAPDDPRHGAFYRGVLTRDGEGKPHYDQDTAWVLGALDMIRSRSGDQPFLCYLPLSKPHPAYCAEKDHYDAIDPDRLPPRIPTPDRDANLPAVMDAFREEYRSDEITEEMWRDIKRIYYAMCSKVDELFGMVVDALVEQGLYDNTWILFFSDHGDFTGDYSLPEKAHSTLQDCLVHVPLIVKPPADVPSKRGNRKLLAELVDVTATLYDLLGVEPGYAHQGVSLRSSLAGEETAIHDAVFAEVGGRANEIGFINTEVLEMPPDSFYARQGRAGIPHHEAGSHAVMCRTPEHKYVRRYYTGHHELFDLVADPGETRNVCRHPDYADVERWMETRLLDFFMHTADVLPHEPDSRRV
ncbi:MAG: sulfatase-like hydrolase/transferase [Candidatus Latescibacteria bacterium]|jgi:arylsulfatase A-like enzyme|nr:sulfatase-like hydrolase/transferase [Candidatus Latescibacterota bacterium]